MKGIKISLLGVCLGILGISFGTNNILAISLAFVGCIFAMIGFFMKEEK